MENNIEKLTIEKTPLKRDWDRYFFLLDLVILVLAMVIPLVLVMINQYLYTCGHHMFNKLQGGAYGWIIGRSLGFTCLIWFCYTVFRGFTLKKNAKIIQNMKKAKSLHCRTAYITILILALHIIILITSQPWRAIILSRRVEHFPFLFYAFKLWTGIIYGTIMVISSILFVYLRDLERLRKFGYKNFLLVHKIMLISAILLITHILFINTEIWLITIQGHIADD